jgi:hypothetical protein
MSLPAKQVRSGTFVLAQVNRVFAAGSVDTGVIAADAIDSTKIAAGAVDTSELAADAVDSTKIAAGAVDSTALAAAAFGNGLAGGGGTTVTVDPDTGITVGAGGVAFDTTASLTMTGTHSHTASTLQITTSPTSANDAVNKGALDSAISGLTWLEPVVCIDLIGNRTVAQINALSPALSDSYLVTDAGTLTTGSLSVAAGDIVEFNGTAWIKTVSNSGGFPPIGTRLALHTTTALVAPYTDGVDDGKIGEFDGASLTATLSSPVDGNAVLVTSSIGDTPSVEDGNGYVFDGTVPTGTWIQFTGAGQINAGTGLTKDGNTINAIGGNGITANADDLEVDLKTSGGLKIDTAQIAVEPADFAGAGLEDDGADNLRIAAAAAGDGLTGGGGSALAVNVGTGLEINTDAVRLATQGNGIAGGAGSTLSFEKDTTGAAQAQADAVALTVAATGVGVDGDLVDLSSLTLANITPDTAGTDSTVATQLGAIVQGIDDALGSIVTQAVPTASNKAQAASVTAADGALATAGSVATTPASDGYVKVEINGINYTVGDTGTFATAPCFFGVGATSVGRPIADIVSGDTLRWNGTVAGFELDGSDVVDMHYDV